MSYKMNNASKLIYHFTLPQEYSRLVNSGHKLILGDFGSSALSYFIEKIGNIPAPWPLGPAANEEESVYAHCSDTSNFQKWKEPGNLKKLANLLGPGARIDFGWRDSMLVPVGRNWELVKNRLLGNAFEYINFGNPNDSQEFSKMADSMGWCGAHLYHQGFWLIVCGKELSSQLDSSFGFYSSSGAVLAASCADEEGFLKLEFWTPKSAH